MNEAPTFDRRRDVPNAALPPYLHLQDHSTCDHHPCSACIGVRIVKGNRDIEPSSWWAFATRKHA